MKRLARILRKESTDAERWLWQRLRNRDLLGWKFRRQHPIGYYIVDFVCIEKRIIIELDGSQHAEKQMADSARSEYLKEKGYQVLRFWNNDVLVRGEAVLSKILSYLNEETPSPRPSPPRKAREGRGP
ncbi:MAG: endonuclease domain-containing protein [Thermodesulfobacteriota bacterium]